MQNPFKNIFNGEKDKVKKTMQKQISAKAWSITQLVIRGKLSLKDINELEKLYDKFFIKYPDIKDESNAKKRIAQLKTMCK